MSPGVSVPVLSSVIKPESPCVPVPVSPGVSSPHSSAMGCDHLIITIIFLFNSLMPLLLSLRFQMRWIGNLLVYKILAILYMLSQLSSSMSLYNLLISNKRDSILSNAEQSTVHSHVQGIFHTNCQQDAHESLLKILDILHNHIKIDLFPGLAFYFVTRSNEIQFYY